MNTRCKVLSVDNINRLEKALKGYSEDIIMNWENYFKEKPVFYTE